MTDEDAWRIADPRLELAVQETWRSLEFQREHLGELRTRIAGALTLSTVAFALLGRSVLTEGKHLRGWGIPPAIGIVLLFAAVTYATIPRSWSFVRLPASLADFWTKSKTRDQMLSNLYADGVRDYNENAEKLVRIERIHTASAVVLGLTLGSLALALLLSK